jgi:hypothetical protein
MLSMYNSSFLSLMQRPAIAWIVLATVFLLTSRARADELPPRCKEFQISLRSDFNDLGPLNCPSDYATAQGASLSLGYNALTNQTSAALDGLVAATKYFPGVVSQGNPFMGATAGVFVQANDTYLFQPTPAQTTNSDTITAGAFAQTALNFFGHGYDLFRFRSGYVQGSTGAYFYSYVAEWVPVHAKIEEGQPVFNTPIIASVIPELMVQYDEFGGGPNKYVIFGFGREDLRIGPQVIMQFSLGNLYTRNPGDIAWAPLAPWSALVSYHASWDEYTGRNFSWTSASITYTFGKIAHVDNDEPKDDKTGHVGLSLSYGYGNSETTGNLTNQVKLGLSVKF